MEAILIETRNEDAKELIKKKQPFHLFLLAKKVRKN